ncbi:DUF4198 domain-containing protein [Pseudoxanthomonas dokdonensis]|uniref:DUF4198 domain-containing protein n=1 Tax=Pseudoxanthomonas dokdonensis TaxID=344882 RepID=A0A0R0CNX6_9GAMM|nr:DUF4198 domain-containing protein [Pseudoxanthomonas dokdonensis]KRG71689.1 hypothetical protein ABB29_02830 [Pseudoxanthomonas dokdonensis]
MSSHVLFRHAAGLVCCLGLLLSAGAAQAHEFWLVPHDPLVEVDSKVVFELRIGVTWPGVQSTRRPGQVEWFRAIDAQGTRDVAGRDESLAVGNLKTRVAGATVVAMRTHPSHIELSGHEFTEYLAEEGLNNVIEMRRQRGLSDTPGREDYSRCAKSIVFVDGSSQGFDAVSGLPLELVPRSDPLAYAPGQPFKVNAMFNGEPLPNALVKAQLKSDPVVELQATSDAAGNVSFDLPQAGLWLFNVVHMEPSNGYDSDWESLWASLTFEIPAPGKR